MRDHMIVAVVVMSSAVVVIGFLDLVSDARWFRFPLSAILAYGLSMTLVAIASRIVSLSLPHWYIGLRPSERSQPVYARFGIDLFRRMLATTGIDACNRLVRFSGRPGALRDLARGMRKAETRHAISFLVILFAIIYSIAKSWYLVAGWLALINVLANVYPIALQRHNRTRVQAILDRFRKTRWNGELAPDTRSP